MATLFYSSFAVIKRPAEALKIHINISEEMASLLPMAKINFDSEYAIIPFILPNSRILSNTAISTLLLLELECQNCNQTRYKISANFDILNVFFSAAIVTGENYKEATTSE